MCPNRFCSDFRFEYFRSQAESDVVGLVRWLHATYPIASVPSGAGLLTIIEAMEAVIFGEETADTVARRSSSLLERAVKLRCVLHGTA